MCAHVCVCVSSGFVCRMQMICTMQLKAMKVVQLCCGNEHFDPVRWYSEGATQYMHSVMSSLFGVMRRLV